MSDRERMEELIEIYCDADARSRVDADELAKHDPGLARVLEVMGGAA